MMAHCCPACLHCHMYNCIMSEHACRLCALLTKPPRVHPALQPSNGAADQGTNSGKGNGAKGQEPRRKPAARQQAAVQAAAVAGDTDSNGSTAPPRPVSRKAATSTGRKKFACQ